MSTGELHELVYAPHRHLVTNRDPGTQAGPTDTDPRPAAVTFVTTEHFTLQGARSSTIAEATGRATMFLGAGSGGLVALGLVATTSNAGAAFYAFGLVLLPTLAFVGLVTFDRALQSGIEDFGYAQRIARLLAGRCPGRGRGGRSRRPGLAAASAAVSMETGPLGAIVPHL